MALTDGEAMFEVPGSRLTALSDAITVKDARIAGLSRQVADKDQEIARLRGQVDRLIDALTANAPSPPSPAPFNPWPYPHNPGIACWPPTQI